MRVLIIEDISADAKALSEDLKQLGHRVEEIQNGQIVKKMFEEDPPDLVFINSELSTEDAFTLVENIRSVWNERSRWIPIVFLGKQMDDALFEKAIMAGGDDFLVKPIHQIRLKAKLKSMRRIIAMQGNILDFGHQLKDLNEKLMASNKVLSELSLKDPLTLLGNRRAFEETLEKETRKANRMNIPLSLIMLDIDKFKPFNDTYGHQEGDLCLKRIGQCMEKQILRPGDFIARYGGEEFSIILPETNQHGAMLVANRVRSAVEALNIPNQGASKGIVTISLGLASSDGKHNFRSESLVALADKALYTAKEKGRNSVYLSSVPLHEFNRSGYGHYKGSQSSPF